MKYLLLVLIFLIPAFPGQLSAQDVREDPSSLLPDLDPQDIEIRGEFRARFAGLSRQPILGFNPTPRVFRIDPNRMPFLETPEEVVASVPLGQLERPLGPQRDLKSYPNRTTLFGYAGVGMFTSPETDLYLSLPLGERTVLHSNINWHSSDGHLDDQPSAFRFFNGHARLLGQTENNRRWYLGVRGRSDFSHALTTNNFRPTRFSFIRPELSSFGAEAGLNTNSSVHDSFRLHGAYTFTGLSPEYLGSIISSNGVIGDPLGFSDREFLNPFPPENVTEHRGDVAIARQWTGNRIGHRFYTGFSSSFAAYSIDQPGDQDSRDLNWYNARFLATWAFPVGTNGELRAGAKLVTGFDELSGTDYLAYPHLEYIHRGTGNISFRALVSGDITNPGLEEIFVYNRTQVFAGPLVNQREFFGDMNLQFTLADNSSLFAGLRGSIFSRPLFFGGLSSANYFFPKETVVIRPKAGFDLNIAPRVLNIFAEGVYNIKSVNDDNIEDYLNLEDYRITAGFRTTASDNFIIRGWADIIGPRMLNLQGDESDNVLLLNAKAEYRFGGNFGVYLKAVNLLGQEYEYWDGYQERPLQIYGGITFSF